MIRQMIFSFLASATFLMAGAQAAQAQSANMAKRAEDGKISCPRTLVAPEAQKLLDAGKKPVVETSPYDPQILSTTGFCRVIAGPDGKLLQTYNEGATIANVPVRAEFHQRGIRLFAAESAAPFATGKAALECNPPASSSKPAHCRILIDKKGSGESHSILPRASRAWL